MAKKITYERLAKKLEELPELKNMSEEDKKLYCQTGQALLVDELELLIRERQWALGVIMAASMLEFVGKIRLIWEYKGSVSQSKIIDDTFSTTIRLLSRAKIINRFEHDKLKGIKKIRNGLAHDLIFQGSTFHDKEPNPDLENIIKDAITLIKCLLGVNSLVMS